MPIVGIDVMAVDYRPASVRSCRAMSVSRTAFAGPVGGELSDEIDGRPLPMSR
jgi:hypothetical protein